MKYTDDYDNYVEKLSDAKDYEQLLGELLAVIHRDGGHYIEEHGLTKAFLDAKSKYINMFAEREDLKNELDYMQEELNALSKSIDLVCNKVGGKPANLKEFMAKLYWGTK
jgi:hypothetical protein